MRNLTLITDAWCDDNNDKGQTNGVVTTLKNLIKGLKIENFKVTVIHPNLFFTFSLPFYKEIKIACNTWNIGKLIENSNPDFIHIATEGPLGFSAKLWLDKNNKKYTTSYHTRFPEYINKQFGISEKLIYKYLKYIHKNSKAIMVNTSSMYSVLVDNGFENLIYWGRGVDTELFTEDGEIAEELKNLSKPIWLNVGRVSIEKNLEEFYKLNLPGSKVQIGDGPNLKEYKKKYKDVLFLGKRKGTELAKYYRSSDVFVFPSKLDTFGLVILEAMASGLPVAAYPVTGPKDIIIPQITGSMNEKLQEACEDILKFRLDIINNCRSWAMSQSWENSIQQFIKNIEQ